jgi:prepilin-type N-terminal cleavage/methylation domain-containing protein
MLTLEIGNVVEKLQASIFKLQGNLKSPNTKLASGQKIGAWKSGFFWSLDFGAWSLSSPRHPSLATRPLTRAFTLIELMVVLVLIGILTAVMIPEMRGSYEDALLRSSSRELINVCHLAYSQAVSLNQVHRLKLDERTGKYFLEKRIRETELGGDFEQLKDVPGSEGTLDTRIKIQVRTVSEEPTIAPTADESATATEPPPASEPAPVEVNSPSPELNEGIAFYPDGSADGREIVLRDREGFHVGLRISPVTARIQIVELPRE